MPASLTAAMAGIAAGRLTRGAVEAQKDSQPQTPAAGGDGWGAEAAREPMMPSADGTSWTPQAPAYPEVQP